MALPRRALFPLVLAALFPASATPAPSAFEALQARAEAVPDLAGFLVAQVGRCTPGPSRAACEADVARARRAVTGKLLAVRVADAAPLLRLEPRAGERFVVLLTPFLDGGGLGLSHGAPARLDGAGNPVVALVGLEGRLAPDQSLLDLGGPFRRGQVELEVVFETRGAWKLPRKGAPALEGVTARFRAVRVLDGRTGAPIVEKVL